MNTINKALRFNPTTGVIEVNEAFAAELATGTPFEQGIKFLEAMLEVYDEMSEELMNVAGIRGKRRKALTHKLRAEKLKTIRDNLPADIDAGAVKVFFARKQAKQAMQAPKNARSRA